MRYLFSILSFFVMGGIYAQPPATAAADLLKSHQQRQQFVEQSLVSGLPFENIGPAIMSGRVVDLEVNPKDPTEFYVAYASGGLWHTTTNGISFNPVMDSAATLNIGDIAVHWPSRTLWVGTGENNSSRSSYAGIGLLKSNDGGATWKNMGLNDSHHIGRIIINPDNANEIVVGVIGHLYSGNAERGIFKTTDGGLSWKKTLFVNNDTGIIDICAAPNHFNVMYAAAWQRNRKAWHFEGSGSGSGIYKSQDAGNSWKRISGGDSGFPEGDLTGRIGLAAFDAHTVYAILDDQRPLKIETKKNERLTKEDFREIEAKDFLALPNEAIEDFLRKNNFPEKHTAKIVKEKIASGKLKPVDIAHWLEDANSALFNTPVTGAAVYRSDDGGLSWKKTHNNPIKDTYYSYGYYFGQISVASHDKEKIFTGGVPILKSDDGGKTFTSINRENVHADHHAFWVNPLRPGHIINGNDGGVNISYDDGESWAKCNTPQVGQFYAIEYDLQQPYHVYGGLQDNGVWETPVTAKENRLWHNEGSYPWKRLAGGDGMQIEIDSRYPNIVITGYQFGNYFRIDRQNNTRKSIIPYHDPGEPHYRFNWQTPILLSKHQQDILYLGANKLFRSFNQGDDWEVISKDLTRGSKKGNVSYGTLTTLAESPFKFGLLYTGSDDGLLYRSVDGGSSWKNISVGLPQNLWVSRVVASAHKESRVYATLNGYRRDDFSPYVYVSEDYGNNWIPINANLPFSSVNAICEDPIDPDLLYLGTDNAAWVTFDRGENWQIFSKGLPAVAVHDIKLQPQENHLLLGTHGRSIYKADVSSLQQFNKNGLDKDLFVFEINPVKHSKKWGSHGNIWHVDPKPQVEAYVYTNIRGAARVKMVSNLQNPQKNVEIYEKTMQLNKGINQIKLPLQLSEKGYADLKRTQADIKIDTRPNGKRYIPKGTYTLIVYFDNNKSHTEFVIN